MDYFEEWAEDEEDRYSGDSDGFDEDSVCSWLSEPESLCNVWRGWKKQSASSATNSANANQGVLSLIELAAKAVAAHIPYEVERFPQPVPEELQLRIAFWSFPQHEEDIRLYSCLASGSAEEFQKGEALYKSRAVKDALQIGYHLSASVVPPQGVSASAKGLYKVSVLFDRRKITECTCTCNEGEVPTWCQHIVAVCLHRIYQANNVCLRAPVSETLLRLDRDQLQKFAQYLIDELPQQILPTAQKLLDELLSSSDAAINKKNGAPDPTAGPSSANERAMWYMNDKALRDNVKKTLVKFCIPTPMVLSDLNCLSSSAPPAAAEWQLLLRPLRGREPEGIWNLLSIVRELLRRQDSNAVHLLSILTDEMMQCEQLLLWWFCSRVSPAHNSIGLNRCTSSSGGTNNNTNSAQNAAAASLCDEVVALWRLFALGPSLLSSQRADFRRQFELWHRLTIDKVLKASKYNVSGPAVGSSHSDAARRLDIELFPGFKPAIEATLLSWESYDVPGGMRLPCGDIRLGSTSEQHGAHVRGQLHVVAHDGMSSESAVDSRCKSSPVSSYQVDTSMYSYASQDDVAAHSARARPHARGQVTCSASADGNMSSSSEGYSEHQEAVASGSAVASSFIARDVDTPDMSRSGRVSQHQLAALGGQSCGFSAAAQGLHSDGTGTCAAPTGRSASSDSRPPRHRGSTHVAPGVATAAAEADALDYLAGMKIWNDQREILFARTEALSAHGYIEDACRLAKTLALQLLSETDSLIAAVGATSVSYYGASAVQQSAGEESSWNKGQSGNGASTRRKCATVSVAALYQQQSYADSFATTTLAKAAFLCVTLLEGTAEYHHLAFRMGMFGLEMPRPPAANKALEVKLANQESELAAVLRRMTLGSNELDIIRERAQQLRDGVIHPRGDAHLPLTLASFIFESLCLPALGAAGCSRPPSRTAIISMVSGQQYPPILRPALRLPSDERLGFEAAVMALGMRMNVAEAEHPLLCEGTRRQRGELAVALLLHYKDDHQKLDVILSKLLDRDVYPHFKTPSISCYLSPSGASSRSLLARGEPPSLHGSNEARLPAVLQQPPTIGVAAAADDDFQQFSPYDQVGTKAARARVSVAGNGTPQGALQACATDTGRGSPRQPPTARDARGATGDARTAGDTDGSALEDDDYKELDAKLRCSLYRTARKHSTGMAAIDSSAPETTSSDNSPTTARRPWPAVRSQPAQQQQQQQMQPQMQGACSAGSDSESSAKSSDSLGSSNSGRHHQAGGSAAAAPVATAAATGTSADAASSPTRNFATSNAGNLRENDSTLLRYVPCMSQYNPFNAHDSRSTTSTKGFRFLKGRSRLQPTVPNQPSEALGHFMFELARLVLSKAGGTSSTSLFTPQQALTASSVFSGTRGPGGEGVAAANMPSAAAAGSGPHRALHLCAFQIGLYSLGVHNCICPNWLSRTYSSQVSWITGQAMEIGSAAISVLIDMWEGHLTPPEVVVLADKASRGRDPHMAQHAAELALSCLPHAHTLNPSEIQRALQQCKEQGQRMLERACLAVEGAANDGGVYPEVLFDVAHKWYELYEDSGGGTVEQYDMFAPAPQAACPYGQAYLHHPGMAVQQGEHMAHPMPSFPFYTPASFHQPPAAIPYAMPYAAALVPCTFPFPPPGYVTYAYQSPPPLHLLQQQPMCNYGAPPQGGPPAYSAPAMGLPAGSAQSPGMAHAFGQGAPIAMVPPGHGVPLQPQPIQQHIQQQQQLIQQQQHAQQHQQAQPLATAAPAQSSAVPVQGNERHAYLVAAYRIGLLAMETLGRRVHDERPQVKYARSPAYRDDIKWLLGVAMKLGHGHVQQFCQNAVNTVVSPFILHDIAIEVTHYVSRTHNHTPVHGAIRTPTLTAVMQRCLQMFVQCTHQRINHIMPSDYDDFVATVLAARVAFGNNGTAQFNEMMQSLRRHKSCKKDLWLRMVNAVHSMGPLP